MGFKTSYKPTTLRDMIPYLQNIKQRGEETVAACPVCEAGDSNGHHLYIRESGGKLLAYCQKCNAKLPEIIKALGIKPEIIKEEMPEVAEEYDHVYKNPDGTVAYWKHRVKYADGSKDFPKPFLKNRPTATTCTTWTCWSGPTRTTAFILWKEKSAPTPWYVTDCWLPPATPGHKRK